MPKKRSGFRGFKRASGQQIARISKSVWVCDNCGLQDQAKAKPAQCLKCGRMAFLFFHSLGEARHWAHLVFCLNQGIITNLRRQVRIDLAAHNPLKAQGGKFTTWTVDFRYTDQKGRDTLCDYKGSAIDPVAELKIKCAEAMGFHVVLATQ